MAYCRRCRQTSCTCGVLPATPTPYYVPAPACKEDHTQKIYYQQFAYGLQIQAAWNIPQCGGSALLNVPGTMDVPVGAYLWHGEYGYFEIIAFDQAAQQITVQNNCLIGNAPPGTAIAACTSFVVTPPSCCEDTNQDGVFVKIDFTAPDVDDCIDITLTSVSNLSTGGLVSIGTGIYRLTEIKSDGVVTICNQGEGIIPGTSVIAQNISGQYQYPVGFIAVNPCAEDQDTVTAGTVMVCADGSSAPLTGAAVGSVLTLVNTTTGEAEYADVIPAIEADIDALDVRTDALEVADQFLMERMNNIIGFYAEASSDALVGPINLNSGNTEEISDDANILITNTSTHRAVRVMYTVVARIYGNAEDALTNKLDVMFDLQLGINGAPYISVANLNESFQLNTDSACPMDRQRVWSGLSPEVAFGGGTFSLAARVVATWEGAGASTYVINNMDVKITAIAVPMV